MKILILGGTGSMGVPLVDMLSKNDNNLLFITSRREHASTLKNVKYIKGNAHEYTFLKSILNTHFDAIIDFMVYDEKEFEKRINDMLESTDQYVFLSSSRVYANSKNPITEKSPRLLDTINDTEYLNTDEYALSKARQENLMINSKYNNWTIIRPYITYNYNRLQLGIYEKETWLDRAVSGRAVVFPKDIAKHITTMTYGVDVSNQIGNLIGKYKALGQVVQITSSESFTWKEIAEVYVKVINNLTGIRPTIYWSDSLEDLSKISSKYQIKYDRIYDRKFDSKKVNDLIGKEYNYLSLYDGLSKCIKEYVGAGKKSKSSARMCAYMDLVTHENTPLREFDGIPRKIKYILLRYTPYFKIIKRLKLK